MRTHKYYEVVSTYGAHAVVCRFESGGQTITVPMKLADTENTTGLIEIHDGDWILGNNKNEFSVMNDKVFRQNWKIVEELPEALE